MIGVIKGDTRSLDYGSIERIFVVLVWGGTGFRWWMEETWTRLGSSRYYHFLGYRVYQL